MWANFATLLSHSIACLVARERERSEGKSLRDSGLVYGFVDGSCCILTVLPVLNPSFVIALGAQDMTKRQNLH